MKEGDSIESLPETSPSGRHAEAVVEEYHALLKQLQGWIREGLATRKRELHLSLVRLRSVNRELALQVRSRKRRVQQAKSIIDRDELIRQTLLYQKNHLQATIEDTRQHPSLYASIIEDEEGTGEVGTDSDASMSMSIEAPDEPGQHRMRLQKLKRELEMRRTLSDGLKARVESLELAKSRLVLKRKELERLRDQLEGIIKASDPLAHSQARLFAELTAARQQTFTEEQLGREDDEMGMRRAMERLGQQLNCFVEGRQDMAVFSFDEVELGEEPTEGETTFERQSEDEASIDSTTARNENTEGEADGDEGARGGEHHHGRFASHHTNVGGSRGRRRRRDQAHILLEMSRQPSEGGGDMDTGATDEPIRIIFVPMAGELLIGLQLDLGEGDSRSAEQIETFLLSLPLEPALLLTVPLQGEQQLRHSAGCIPFRWIQCLAGLAAPDSAFADVQAVLHAFLMAIKDRAGTMMGGGGP